MTETTRQQVAEMCCCYCLAELHPDRSPRCWHCGALHHRDCWYANGGCSQFACPAGPKEDS